MDHLLSLLCVSSVFMKFQELVDDKLQLTAKTVLGILEIQNLYQMIQSKSLMENY